LLFLSLLAGAGFQCKPSRISSSLTGKLVAVGPCSQYVVQVIEGSYPPTQVDTVWKNIANDSVFHNVFAVGNACTFALNGLEQGAIFSFEWDPKAPEELCATCKVFYPTPSKYNILQHVRRIK
jgi:hypothetical protein